MPDPIEYIEHKTREQKMCGAKPRYLPKEDAFKKKQSIEAKDPLPAINVYQCPFCHYWHTGRQRVMK